ncbi:MAG: hypothetical protein AA931_05965 [Peptococcaceae bacterium 1109]|jgi:hypothetical protein|nr:MAG: hypothetical protein AA931_05965 [Peptococcaceae bacterium 1109]
MIFFDTDCISAFLWVKREDLLVKLKLGRLILPQAVMGELLNPSVPHLGQRARNLLSVGHVETMDIMTGTEEAALFKQMTTKPLPGLKPIGKGEAAALVLARAHNGIIASNNISDISYYVREYNLPRMTTGYFLGKAYEAGLISDNDANKIWSDMLARKRLLPSPSFSKYYAVVYPQDQVAAGSQ